jgi:hypothetical protein
MMQFFKMSSTQSEQGGFTDCAALLDPPMIISASNAFNYPEPIMVGLQSVGRKWMDFLAPQNGHAPLLCSQRVLDGVLRGF